MNRPSYFVPLIALSSLALAGCAMFKSEMPVRYTRSAVALGNANQIKTAFRVNRASNGDTSTAEVSDAVLDERSTNLASLEETEATVLTTLNTTLQNMQLRADKYSGQRIASVGGATLLSIAATILTVANPAANAATIAGLTATSTGVFSLQSARTEEGISRAAVIRQRADLLTAFTAAHADYQQVFLLLANGLGDTEAVWLGHYARAFSLLNKLNFAATSEGITEFAAADATLANAATASVISANSLMLSQSLASKLQVSMEQAAVAYKQADKALESATANKKKADDDATKAAEPADAATVGTENNTKLVAAQATAKAQAAIVNEKQKAADDAKSVYDKTRAAWESALIKGV